MIENRRSPAVRPDQTLGMVAVDRLNSRSTSCCENECFHDLLLSCGLHVRNRRYRARTKEETAREVQRADPGEITADRSQPQKQRQRVHDREEEQVMNGYALLDEDMNLSRYPRERVGRISLHQSIHLSR